MSRARRCARGVLVALAVLVAVLLLPVGAASAHPLGNFTVNTHVGLRVEPDAVLVRLGRVSERSGVGWARLDG